MLWDGMPFVWPTCDEGSNGGWENGGGCVGGGRGGGACVRMPFHMYCTYTYMCSHVYECTYVHAYMYRALFQG